MRSASFKLFSSNYLMTLSLMDVFITCIERRGHSPDASPCLQPTYVYVGFEGMSLQIQHEKTIFSLHDQARGTCLHNHCLQPLLQRFNLSRTFRRTVSLGSRPFEQKVRWTFQSMYTLESVFKPSQPYGALVSRHMSIGAL